MKKDYETRIRQIRKRGLTKYVFVIFLFAIIMMALFLIPTDCDDITGSYVSLDEGKMTFKKCRNIYGFDIGLVDLND